MEGNREISGSKDEGNKEVIFSSLGIGEGNREVIISGEEGNNEVSVGSLISGEGNGETSSSMGEGNREESVSRGEGDRIENFRRRERKGKDKSILQVGCVNVRGWNLGKFNGLSEECREWDIDIIGLTETSLRGDLMTEDENFKLIGKGRERIGKKGGGVGIMVRKNRNIDVEQIEIQGNEWTEDIFVAKCEVKVGRSRDIYIIIICYMTVQGMDADRENRRKYEILGRLVNKFKDERILLMGDMNAHTGILGEPTNTNGRKLLDFAEEFNLEILNHTIAKGKVTWYSKEYQSAIDYILVNGWGRAKVLNMWIDEDGVIDVDSDHNLMIIDCYLPKDKETKQLKQKVSQGKKRWKLKGVTWENFEVDLQVLDCLYYDVNQLNNSITTEINKSANEHIKKTNKVGKETKKNWFNQEIKVAIDKRQEKNRECRKIRKDINRGVRVEEGMYSAAWSSFLELKRRVHYLVREAMSKEEKFIIDRIREKGEEEGKDWYRFLKGDIKGMDNIDEIIVDGKVLSDRKDIKIEVEKFWKHLSGTEINWEEGSFDFKSVRKNIPEFDHEISKEEIRKYIKSLKNNKAAGYDQIPYEMLKNGGEWVIEHLFKLFKLVWVTEKVPDAWKIGEVKLIHKGGNKSKKLLKNYRPIALLNTIGKSFVGIMNMRMKQITEIYGVISEEQNGFRSGRRGEDNLYIVREIIEKYNRENRTGFITFIDTSYRKSLQ